MVVQVTDDTHQHIWYVENADLIVVPSQKTKEKLVSFQKQFGLPYVKLAVVPYPISPTLTYRLDSVMQKSRLRQLNSTSHASIHVSIPISGAAVGLQYFKMLVDRLHLKSERFIFHVTSKYTSYTHNFLDDLSKRSFIHQHVSSSDRMVVDKYETVYKTHPITLEITKPSEQAFKALCTPEQVGGALLLFAEPIGRQEEENLDFLRRHHIIPLENEQKYLWYKSKHKKALTDDIGKKILKNSIKWRGIQLPKDPIESAEFIWWCLKEGIFEHMIQYKKHPMHSEADKKELNPDGVIEFWKTVEKLLERT